MGGGDAKKDRQLERDIASEQNANARELAAVGKERLALQTKYETPIANLMMAIIGGDRAAGTQMASPMISEISKGSDAAREQIYNTVPAGAGRDMALAQLASSRSRDVSGTLNNTWQNAFQVLANLGKENAGVGLQGYGGALSGFGGASNTMGSVLQSDAASQQAMFGLIGGLAGTAGSIVGAAPWKAAGSAAKSAFSGWNGGATGLPG